MTKKTSPAYRASKEETIPINKLHPFSNHPFHIRHDLEFSELVDSISESGIITPIIVRPKVGVGYEVISGHRRWEACKELGIESIPARVEYIDDDEATILMVTHDAFTASFAHRILFIKDGRIFNELVRGDDDRKTFFNRIIEVVSLLGGDTNNVL